MKTRPFLFSRILICRCFFVFRKRNPHARQGPEDTYFSSSGWQKTLFVSINLFYSKDLNLNLLTKQSTSASSSYRAIEAFENLCGPTYIWGPQYSSPQVCHWNPPQPYKQRKSHWSWWVTALLRQSCLWGSPQRCWKIGSVSKFTVCFLHFPELNSLNDSGFFSEIKIHLAAHNMWRHFFVRQLCRIDTCSTTKSIEKCFLEGYHRALLRPFICISFFQFYSTFTLWTNALFQQTLPPWFPMTMVHVTSDSHALTPQEIHQLYNCLSVPI